MEPSYSRDELVSELKSYYEFLTQLYLPPEVVQYPPEGGWEHITPEFIDSFCLGKNDTVADLMKHIPYVRRTKQDDWDPWMVYEGATAVDFTGDVVLSLPTKYANEFLFEPQEGSISDIPPIGVVHATVAAGRDGHHLHRLRARHNCPRVSAGRSGSNQIIGSCKPLKRRLTPPAYHSFCSSGEIQEAPDEEAWRRFQTYTFPEFFSMAKEKFRNFEIAALDRKHVHYTNPDTPQARIYREEGVFTERYDSDRCVKRLDELSEQKDRGNGEA